MESDIANQIKSARIALDFFESYSQRDVDRLVMAIGKKIFDHAEHLAALALRETGLGVFEDKVAKNRGKSQLIWNNLKDKPSVGIIDRNTENGIVSIARPLGVVASITPVTNPSTTPMANAMIALKGRNVLIVAPHPSAVATTNETVQLMNESLAELGAPENLIQLLAAPSYERTQVLMREVDTVIATGGAKMVKAAYSSGTPAFGVGPGNVQVIFDDAIDYCVAARAVVTGKTFDNGIICSSEQFVHFPSKDEARVLKSFTDAGAFLIDNPDLILKLEKALFPGGIQNKALIGRSVSVIAEAASISIPPTTRVLMVRARPGDQDPFRREKMFPVLSYESYNTLIEAIESANRNLRLEGMGHTCVVHSNSNLMIEQVALELYVSRIVVNQPGSLSAGGNFRNGLAPSTTLGCGSWGHNSISVNLDYHHLLNIQKIAIPVERRVPKSEEIWTLVESSLED